MASSSKTSRTSPRFILFVAAVLAIGIAVATWRSIDRGWNKAKETKVRESSANLPPSLSSVALMPSMPVMPTSLPTDLPIATAYSEYSSSLQQTTASMVPSSPPLSSSHMYETSQPSTKGQFRLPSLVAGPMESVSHTPAVSPSMVESAGPAKGSPILAAEIPTRAMSPATASNYPVVTRGPTQASWLFPTSSMTPDTTQDTTTAPLLDASPSGVNTASEPASGVPTSLAPDSFVNVASGEPKNAPITPPSFRPTHIAWQVHEDFFMPNPPIGKPVLPSRPSSRRPATKPTRMPSMKPVVLYTRQLTRRPTRSPTRKPTAKPIARLPAKPASLDAKPPTRKPTRRPTLRPARQPTKRPTAKPTYAPRRQPTKGPFRPSTKKPTAKPTQAPQRQPTKALLRLPIASPKASANEDTLTIFYGVGDVPYTARQVIELTAQMKELPKDAEFVIHVGDVLNREEWEPCPESDYIRAAEVSLASNGSDNRPNLSD
jgi:hypothetical protein